MPLFAYNRDIPDGPNNPSQDQPLMKTNTNSIDDLIDTDHFSFDEANGGYHRSIHQPQGSDPAAVATVNQVYSKSYTPDTTGGTADTQLFTRTGGGTISQLTGFNTTDSDNGYQWIGGVLIQWGRIDETTSSGTTVGTVTFKDRTAGMIPFPNDCFTVITCPVSSSSSDPSSQMSIAIKRTTLTKLGFTYVEVTNSSAYRGFRWVAIGN